MLQIKEQIQGIVALFIYNWVSSVVLKNAELSEQRYSKEYWTEWAALF